MRDDGSVARHCAPKLRYDLRVAFVSQFSDLFGHEKQGWPGSHAWNASYASQTVQWADAGTSGTIAQGELGQCSGFSQPADTSTRAVPVK
jgi:hypothetical protein